MVKRHLPWLVVTAVALAAAAVPRLRDEARFQWVMLPRHIEPALQRATVAPRPDPIMNWVNSYRERCMQYVQDHHPDDAEMLMAAGMLAPDRVAGIGLLERAADLNPNPVSLSAYVDGLLDQGPYYETPATLGIDPQWPEQVAAAKGAIAKQRVPPTISKREAAPLLAALARWQRADPGNALPVAIEVWCQNGLGEREKAIARWQQAARLPEVNAYTSERVASVRKLLVRMGLPLPEAIVGCQSIGTFPSLSALNVSARIAYHEGRRAQLEGRPEDALRCWQATVDLGRRAQACADLLDEFRFGVDVEAFGAAPAWRWFPDSATGAQGGGVMQGRFFYGPQHAFYRTHVGERGDAGLREGLVAAKTRTMLLQQYSEMVTEPQWYTRAGELLVFGQLAGGFLIVAGVMLAFATWARRRGDPPGPALRAPWLLLTSLPAVFVLAAAAGLTVAFSRDCPGSPLRVPRGQDLLLGVALSAVTALVVPAIPALFARRAGIRRARAWLDSLRAGLPVAIVVCAALYLGLSLGAMQLRQNWVEQNVHPMSEMERARRAAGRRWENPPVRPGSWVNGYPRFR
jgi:hypothetical protein